MDKVNGEEALKSRFSYTCSLHHLAFMYLSKKACFVNSFALISSFNSLAGFWFLHKVSCFLARKYLYHLTLDQDDLKRIDFVSNRAKKANFQLRDSSVLPPKMDTETAIEDLYDTMEYEEEDTYDSMGD